MKKLLLFVSFIVISLSVQAQNYDLKPDPVDPTKLILEQSQEVEEVEDQQVIGKDSSVVLNQIFQLIESSYNEIGAIEYQLELRKKALRNLEKLPKKIFADTSYTDYSNANFFQSWEGNYQIRIEKGDWLDFKLEKTKSGKVRLKGTKTINVDLNSRNSITLKKVDIEGEQVNVTLYRSPRNNRLFLSNNATINLKMRKRKK